MRVARTKPFYTYCLCYACWSLETVLTSGPPGAQCWNAGQRGAKLAGSADLSPVPGWKCLRMLARSFGSLGHASEGSAANHGPPVSTCSTCPAELHFTRWSFRVSPASHAEPLLLRMWPTWAMRSVSSADGEAVRAIAGVAPDTIALGAAVAFNTAACRAASAASCAADCTALPSCGSAATAAAAAVVARRRAAAARAGASAESAERRSCWCSWK